MTDPIRLNTKELTLKVKFPPAYGLRLCLAAGLIRLAGWVAGVQTELVDTDTPRPAILPETIERLSLNAGDRLVIHFSGRLSTESASRIRETMDRWAPPGVLTLVLDDAARLSVVSQGDSNA